MYGKQIKRYNAVVVAALFLVLLPFSVHSSPIDQLQNNHTLNPFIMDKDGGIYLLQKDTLYYKSKLFGDVWGKKAVHIKTLAIDPTNSELLYVITTENKVQKTADSGKSWRDLQGLPTGARLNCIFINPHNSQEVFIGTWDGLYKSGDGGASFTQLGLKKGIAHFFVNPNNKSIYYAVTVGQENAIPYISRDAGATWVSLDASMPKITAKGQGRSAQKIPYDVIGIFMFVNHKSPYLLSLLYSNKAQVGKFFKSSDDGNSWIDTKRDITPTYVAEDEVLGLGYGISNVIYSSNDGINWEKIDFIGQPIMIQGMIKDNNGLLINTDSGQIVRIDY